MLTEFIYINVYLCVIAFGNIKRNICMNFAAVALYDDGPKPIVIWNCFA